MTRYEKIAISLPSHTAERVRRAVKNGEAPSASAYITNAIERKLTREEGIAMLDEWLEESGGPMTAEEKRMVDRELYRPRSYGPASKTPEVSGTRVEMAKPATRKSARKAPTRRTKPLRKARS